MTYRPPGRSNRSGRTQTDNDVFEGLPVKQWGQQLTHISLAPPKSEDPNQENDKWAEPPMPRDYQMLQPWTQQLLRMARSGKVGTKRKPDMDSMDEDKPEDEANEENKANMEDRGYLAKKWKWVPEAMLEPEHKHFEFLAKRRKGLPNLYGPEAANGAVVVPMRKTKVQRAGAAEGETLIYEVLIPEGAKIEGELPAEVPAELTEIQPVTVTPGTVIEGLGIANDEGTIVAEHLKPNVSAPRRNRPPAKKKGGPGRGKKRVTFTNPDGSTYTTIVPNATKIVPQPGQTVKHVAKGEEASADVTAEQAALQKKPEDGEEGEGGDEGSDEGDDEDDDGREDGELSDEEDEEGNKSTAPATPMGAEKTDEPAKVEESVEEKDGEDVKMEDAPLATETVKTRDASSSPELPLAKSSHSRQNSLLTPSAVPEAAESEPDDPEPQPEAIDAETMEAEPKLPQDATYTFPAQPTDDKASSPPPPAVVEVAAADVIGDADETAEAEAAVVPDATVGPDATEGPDAITEADASAAPDTSAEADAIVEAEPPVEPPTSDPQSDQPNPPTFPDGDEDLLGNLEKSLGHDEAS